MQILSKRRTAWLNLLLILTLLSNILGPVHPVSASGLNRNPVLRVSHTGTPMTNGAVSKTERPPGQPEAAELAPSFSTQPVAKLTITDTDADRFGQSVTIEGQTAVIGAEIGLGNQGAAYTFERVGGNWMQEVRVLPPAEGTRFARRVDLSGDRFVGGAEEGAYVYSRDGEGGWTEEARIEDCDATVFDRRVAISSDLVIVEGNDEARVFRLGGSGGPVAPCDNNGGGEGGVWNDPGSGEEEPILLVSIVGGPLWFGRESSPPAVFGGKGNWTEQAILTGHDTAAFDGFGSSIALSGDYALIGAPFNGDVGAAYIFKRNADDTWTQEAKLVAGDGGLDDRFGWSVGLSGDYAIIGAVRDDSDTGSAYIFQRNGSEWGQNCSGETPVCEANQKLAASNRNIDDEFGYSVAIDGQNAVVGPGREIAPLSWTPARPTGSS